MVAPAFCANCTEERTDLARHGKLWLCPDCDPESPVQRRARPAVYRGYDVPERGPAIGALHVAVRRATARVAPGSSLVCEGRGLARAARPGFVLVRVLRRSHGKVRDAEEARRTLAGEPWFAELQYIGCDRTYFIFDRPDAELAKKVRNEVNFNAMDVLRDAVDGVSKR